MAAPVPQAISPHPNPPQPEQKEQWIRNAAIVTTVVGVIFFGAGYFCTDGTFPPELIGGRIGVAVFSITGFFLICLGGGYLLLQWIQKKEEAAQRAAENG